MTTQPANSSLRDQIESVVAEHAHREPHDAGDPGGFLNLAKASTEALHTCESLQKEAVHQARRADHSWSDIGNLLGITRQAAQQRFAADTLPAEDDQGIRRITWANANDEMQILKTVGLNGYHLVELGGLWMEVAQSTTAWEHRREVSDEIAGKQAEIEAQGWEYVGRWFPFHYFKRKLNRKPGAADRVKEGADLYPKEWHATHEGHQIRVRNSWNRGIKLFVDDVLWAENGKMMVLDKHTPVLRAEVQPEAGKPFVVEVFAHAVMSVKAKIAVNGAVIAGDTF